VVGGRGDGDGECEVVEKRDSVERTREWWEDSAILAAEREWDIRWQSLLRIADLGKKTKPTRMRPYDCGLQEPHEEERWS